MAQDIHEYDYSLTKQCSDEKLLGQQRLIYILTGVAAIALAACAVLSVSVARLGMSVKNVPMVVLMDSSGAARRAGPPQEISFGDPVWVSWRRTTLADFIFNWRGVTLDPVFQKKMWDDALAVLGSGSQAEHTVKAWYAKNIPNIRAKTLNVTTEVEYTNAVSDETYLVEWAETETPIGSTPRPAVHWQALLTYFFDKSSMRFFITKVTTTRKETAQ